MYKLATIVAFGVNLVFSLMYVGGHPHDGRHRHSLPDQSWRYQTPFSISHVFTTIYWVVLFIVQIGYIWHLFSSKAEHVKAAASVGAHFTLFNLLQFAFVMLFTRSQFWLAEVMMALNFLQMSALYLRNSATPRTIHLGAVAMPLVWTFFSTFWFGAVAVNCTDLPCRILANVSIWSIFVFAAFFLLVFKDYHVGFSTAFLAAGLGVGQFFTKLIALQWIFAFAIMAAVFVFTVFVAVPEVFGSETEEQRERAPLLAGENA
jgi:hypothetical protein